MQEIINNKKISWENLFIYYGMIFSKRCNFLLSLSLLIASVKTLISLNKQNELLAFQTAGVPIYRLIRPFFFVGLICVALNYYNFEILSPKSLNYIDHFEQKYLNRKNSCKKAETSIHTLPLGDGTRLIYQSYDTEKKEFLDIFWVRSSDDIYHMKTLRIKSPHPIGTFVDHMKRNENGQIEKIDSFPKHSFESLYLKFDLQDHFEESIENRSITQLAIIILNKNLLFHENRWIIQTYLYFKLFMPWIPILVLIGLIPICISSSRNHQTFLIFSLTIFGYISFFTIMDGCVVLGELNIITPFFAIFTLPISFFFIFGHRFIKLCIR